MEPAYLTQPARSQGYNDHGPARMETGVRVSLDQLRGQVEAVNKMVYQLAEKIEPILQPESSERNPDPNGIAAPSRPKSPISCMIDESRGQLNAIERQLAGLCARADF